MDPALLPELLRVFTDRTDNHEVMWGLLHLVEDFPAEDFYAAMLDVLPLDDAREWIEILHFRTLNSDTARQAFSIALAAASGPGAAASRAILEQIVQRDQPPLRDRARVVLDAIAAPLADRFPQLLQIRAAIAEHRMSGAVTTRCTGCNEVLTVVEVPGRRVVGCRCGRCRYSERSAI
jgi:hypothetical protein